MMPPEARLSLALLFCILGSSVLAVRTGSRTGTGTLLSESSRGLRSWGKQLIAKGQHCQDLPDWTDRDGDDCSVYEAENWCHQEWIMSWANSGRTGREACCACGGGIMLSMEAPVPKVAAAPVAAAAPKKVEQAPAAPAV